MHDSFSSSVKAKAVSLLLYNRTPSTPILHCTLYYIVPVVVQPHSAMQENHDCDDHSNDNDEVLQKDSDPQLRRQGVPDEGDYDLQQQQQQVAAQEVTTETSQTTTDRHTVIRWTSICEELSFRQVMQGITKFRKVCGAVVNHEYVQLVCVILIAINAIMMGIATFDFVTDNPDIDAAFEKVDLAFLIIFTIEFTLQLIYHGLKLFLDGWLVFDCIVIVASWALSSVQIIRAFRIFRALRLITRIEIMKNLVLAVFSVMPRMAAIGLLLVLIFYIFAVMMTQMFKDLYQDGKTEEDYFSTLGLTFFTLFQMMTLDNWADISRQVIADYFWAWIPIFFFVTISGFVVVNLIIAVICDAVSSLHDDVKAKIHGSYHDNDSQSTPEPDLREQLGTLEDQVDELTRIQEQMLNTLTNLMLQLQNCQPTTSDT